MSVCNLSRVACIFCGAILTLVSPASAADPAVREAVTHLFDVGWDESLEARAAAEEFYESLTVADPLLTYAYALIQARHRQYKTAVALMDDSLSASPDQPNVLRSKIWFLLLQKEAPQALASMERLARLVAETPPESTDLTSAQRLDLARFLGRMYGYLEGPAANMTSPLAVGNSERKVTEQLDPEQLEAFRDAKQALLLVYDEFVGEREQELEESGERADQRREEKLQEIAASREELVLRRAELDAQRGQLQSEMNAALAKLDAEDSRLAPLIAPVQSDLVLFGRELGEVIIEIARLQSRYDEEENPDIRRQIYYRIIRLESIARAYEYDIVRGEQQLAILLTQRNDLQTRRQQTQVRFGRQLQGVESGLADLKKQERRLDVERERLDKGTVDISRRARSLSARAGALLTYEPFPFEPERQRVVQEVSGAE